MTVGKHLLFYVKSLESFRKMFSPLKICLFILNKFGDKKKKIKEYFSLYFLLLSLSNIECPNVVPS